MSAEAGAVKGDAVGAVGRVARVDRAGEKAVLGFTEPEKGNRFTLYGNNAQGQYLEDV